MKTRKIRNKHNERGSQNRDRNAEKNETAVYSLAKSIDKKERINIEKFAGFFFFIFFDTISECIKNLMVWPLRVETNVENGLDIKTKRFRLNFLMETNNAERSVLTFKGSTKTIILRNRSVFYLRIRSHFSPPQEIKKRKTRADKIKGKKVGQRIESF